MLPCFFRNSIHKSPHICWAYKQLWQFSKLHKNVSDAKYKIFPTAKLNFHSCQTFKMNRSFEKILNHRKRFHSTSKLLFSSDIPDYLKEIANKVPELEEDIFDDGEELENNMEDEIVEYLLPRAISYEELDGSFIVICPSCGHSDKTHDVFIDKNSGYCVCPWCCWDGNWKDLVKLFDAKEDSLTVQQLENYFFRVSPIEEVHLPLLNSSPLMNIGMERLTAVEAGITSDHSQIIFPLKDDENRRVGFASMSLLHPKPKIVKRVLEGKSAVFCGLSFPKTKKMLKRVVVVSNICDSLHLAKLKIYGVVLISDPKPKTLNLFFQSFKNVVLWLDSSDIPPSLLPYLKSQNIKSSVVKLKYKPDSIQFMSEKEVSGLLIDSLPILSGSVITVRDIKDQIYARIINKEEMFGVKWSRFTELNELLLGHREGELTVFSGQTGSGKTTFASEYSLDLCMQGVSTLWGSFEVNVPRLCEIMLRQFSGKALPENPENPDFNDLFDKFSELPLCFLDNHGQHPLQDVINEMTEEVKLRGVRHVVIDNLQFMLGLHGGSADWWLEQDRAVGAFRKFATALGCHVTLIVHPRKMHMGEKLNLHSISGGARVTQEADNVMILHVKENKDGSSNSAAPKTLQIAKNRYGGTLGEMRLKFHKESLTLSSCFQKQKSESESHLFNEDSMSQNLENLTDVKGIPSLHLDR